MRRCLRNIAVCTYRRRRAHVSSSNELFQYTYHCVATRSPHTIQAVMGCFNTLTLCRAIRSPHEFQAVMGCFNTLTLCLAIRSPHTRWVEGKLTLSSDLHVRNLPTFDRKCINKLICHTMVLFTGNRDVALGSRVSVVAVLHGLDCSISTKTNLSSSDKGSAILKLPAGFWLADLLRAEGKTNKQTNKKQKKKKKRKKRKKKDKNNARLFRKYFAKRIPQCLPWNVSKP